MSAFIYKTSRSLLILLITSILNEAWTQPTVSLSNAGGGTVQ